MQLFYLSEREKSSVNLNVGKCSVYEMNESIVVVNRPLKSAKKYMYALVCVCVNKHFGCSLNARSPH